MFLFSVLSLISLNFFACNETEKDDTAQVEPSFQITNLQVTSAACDGEEIPEDSYNVSVDGDVANVVHSNFEASSCLDFQVEGLLEGSNLSISYTEQGEACDCISVYTLEYDIENLGSGAYDLNLPGGGNESISIE